MAPGFKGVRRKYENRETQHSLDVARLIADLPTGETLRTSDIRTGGDEYGESGGQRFREFAIKARKLYGKSHEYIGHGRYAIYRPLKWVCRKYVREHELN